MYLLLHYWRRNCSCEGSGATQRRKSSKCNTALQATHNMLQSTCAIDQLARCICGAAAMGTVWHVEQGLVLACDRSQRTVVVYPSKGWKVVFHTLWHRTSEAACRFLNLNFLTTIAVVHIVLIALSLSLSLALSTSRSKYINILVYYFYKQKEKKFKYYYKNKSNAKNLFVVTFLWASCVQSSKLKIVL